MTTRPGFVSVTDYLLLPHQPETWLLRPLIPTGGVALLYGAEKTGKSALAIQLAAALSGHGDNWLGFSIPRPGRVLYLQLDTPRSTWRLRFEKLRAAGVTFNDDLLKLADRDCVDFYPFDALQPQHIAHLRALVTPLAPAAVIIDTLRESHSGDEDTSTTMRNVLTNLVGAIGGAAMIIVSHSRKPHPDVEKNLMADHRGSSYTTGRMDAILRLTKTKLFYGGRSIEEGDMKLQRQDIDGALLWSPAPDEHHAALMAVMADPSIATMRAKARVLAPQIHKTEEAAMSLIRRTTEKMTLRPPSTGNGACGPAVTVEATTSVSTGATPSARRMESTS